MKNHSNGKNGEIYADITMGIATCTMYTVQNSVSREHKLMRYSLNYLFIDEKPF
jgi:hypothetical protein